MVALPRHRFSPGNVPHSASGRDRRRRRRCHLPVCGRGERDDATVITGIPVAGVSMVTVSGDRTQLTLSGVQREVDGATVVCTALASTEQVISNLATITVQCK